MRQYSCGLLDDFVFKMISNIGHTKPSDSLTKIGINLIELRVLNEQNPGSSLKYIITQVSNTSSKVKMNSRSRYRYCRIQESPLLSYSGCDFINQTTSILCEDS